MPVTNSSRLFSPSAKALSNESATVTCIGAVSSSPSPSPPAAKAVSPMGSSMVKHKRMAIHFLNVIIDSSFTDNLILS